MFDKNNIEIFSSRDQIRNQLIEYVKNYLELENLDLNNANYLGYLVNILSALTSNLIYYNSIAWREFFLTKALQKESVINLALMLGYRPKLATPASCSVLLEIPLQFPEDSNTYSFDLIGVNEILSKGGNISGSVMQFYAGDIPFSVKYSTHCTIFNNNGVYSANIYRKQYLESSYEKNYISIPYRITDDVLRFYVDVIQIQILKGTELEFTFENIKPYSFYTKDIKFEGDLSEIRIFTSDENSSINETLASKMQISSLLPINSRVSQFGNPSTISWRLYDSLFLIPENEYGYTYKLIDGGIRIFFGNGIIGMQPESGATCRILLGITKGSLGNIIQGAIDSADRITIEGGPLKFNAINMEPAFGGKDAPTTDEIRTEAIAQVGANKRLVTTYDYDRMNLIVDPGDLPINHAIHLLKRSDIGANIITLFTDLVYHTIENESYIVPTRNMIASRECYDDYDEIKDSILIKSGEICISTISDYVSLFNIICYPKTQECKYVYVLTEMTKPFIMTGNESTDSFISIKSCDFSVVSDAEEDEDETDLWNNNKLNIDLYYEVYNNPRKQVFPSQLFCQMITPDGRMILLANDVLRKRFTLEDADDVIGLGTLPWGECDFVFYIYDALSERYKNHFELHPGINEPQSEEDLKNVYEITGKSSIIVKQDLSEFMYSSVVRNDTLKKVTIYDVPAIYKDYYDSVNKSLFELHVLSKIADFDVSKYRMLTDFVNLKFSNTTGNVRNLNYNPVTKEDVDYIDPQDIFLTSVEEGTRVAISDIRIWDNWFGGVMYPEAPFIATKVSYGLGWIYERLTVNDIFIVTWGGHSTPVKFICNGEKFYSIDINQEYITIPLQLEIIVWVDYTEVRNSQAFVQQIKEELINEFYLKFGYDKSIYVAEITKVVKSIPGVRNCNVVRPQFDVIFTYDIHKDLTPEQLRLYSPNLIYFDSNSIEIELR